MFYFARNYVVSKNAAIKTESNYKTLAAEKSTLFLHEIKATKQPVGNFEFRKNFNNEKIQLTQGDIIYIFSDGFHDQFGGVKGKKYMSLRFKKLLLKISEQNHTLRRKALKEEFIEWTKDHEQIDDVCVFSVEL